MPARFEVKRSRGQFMFVLRAPNGRIILTSERYKKKRGALVGIRAVRRCALKKARFDFRRARDGSPYFVLVAASGEIVGHSEMYSSTSSRNRGVVSVQRNAPQAALEDRT